MAEFKVGDRVMVRLYGGDPLPGTVLGVEGPEYVWDWSILSDQTGLPYPAFESELTLARTAYLAGPMTGIDLFNFPAFEDAAEDLRARGWRVISPAEMDIEEGFEPSANGDDQDPAEYAAFLARDIERIAKEDIDAIVLLPGWEKSGGAKTEVAFCRALGKEVLSYPTLGEIKDPAEPLSVSFTTKFDGPEFKAAYDQIIGGAPGLKIKSWTMSGGGGQPLRPFAPLKEDKDITPVGGGTLATMDDDFYFGIKDGPSKATVSDPHLNPKDAAAQASGKTRLDLLEPAADAAIADALADGERKYGTRNYVETPIQARVYAAAMRRHLAAWLSGQDYAADSGLHHLAHVGANVHIVFAAIEAGMLNDDRPKKETA